MTKSSSGSGKTPADRRKDRLAQALRDNLKKRKSQAKERQEDRKDQRREADSGDAEPPPGPEAPPSRRP